MNEPRILMMDLETSPTLGYVWSLWNNNLSLDKLVDVTSVMSWGAKWLGEPKKNYMEGSLHHDGREQMLQRIWVLFDEADCVMGYNSRGFDVKHLNREWFLAGMTPPSPFKNIDLMLEVKKNFRFLSNKLQHVSTQLGLAGKEDTGGFSTWVGCIQNDPKAWKAMLKYQRTDVLLLEDLYTRLKPWINTPNLALYADNDQLCPSCGVEGSIQKRGMAYTNLATYQRLWCKECGAWSRGRKVLRSVDPRPTFNN